MKVLTVQQPWASMIAMGYKPIENRTTAWQYRGPLAIHAGTRYSDRGARDPRVVHAYLDARETQGWVPVDPRATFEDLTTTGIARDTFPSGVVLAVVDLTGVHRAALDFGALTPCCDSPWAEQQYEEAGGRTRREVIHLELENVRLLSTPIRAKGRLGLWTPDPDLEEEITRGLA